MILRRLGGCLLGLALGGPAAAQSLPPGKGRQTFRRICGNCHSLTIATDLRLSADQWRAVMDDMVSQGAEGTDEDFRVILGYLTTNFGKTKDGGESKAPTTGKIDINTAGIRALTEVLGLSNRDAAAIVQYRRRHGALKDWPDLRKVPGIDWKKLEERKDRISFTPIRGPAGSPK